MPYRLINIAGILRKAGLSVIEQPGWKTRGHGDMGAVRGVICHHTAECRDADTEPALHVITHGRPGLSGPLCNLGLGQAGDYYIIAAGRAYHAGKGAWQGQTSGNSHFIGIEAENDGIGEPWPEKQMDAYARGCAALAIAYGFHVSMVIGHKEWATPKGRKSDPSFDMAAFRRRVTDCMEQM